jgi:SAM-dependent methyltransferase
MARLAGATVARGASTIRRQVRSLISDPAKARVLVTRRYWRTMRFHLNPPGRGRWETVDGVRIRRYDSYEQYVEHQRSKLELLELADYDAAYRGALAQRLALLQLKLTGRSVVCLAARLGTEVKAFHDRGAFAVGTDLNPGPGNRLVLPGDFHNIQFPDDAVDIVFSNSIDHSLDPPRLAREVARVLKPGGHAVLELAAVAPPTSVSDNSWEAFRWLSHDDALALFTAAGLEEAQRLPISYPSTHELLVVLRKPGPDG